MDIFAIIFIIFRTEWSFWNPTKSHFNKNTSRKNSSIVVPTIECVRPLVDGWRNWQTRRRKKSICRVWATIITKVGLFLLSNSRRKCGTRSAILFPPYTFRRKRTRIEDLIREHISRMPSEENIILLASSKYVPAFESTKFLSKEFTGHWSKKDTLYNVIHMS